MTSRGKLFLWLGIGIGLFMLLVAAGIGTILVVGLRQARMTAQRAACASNLKGLGSATAIYAAAWSDHLPTPDRRFQGSWLCDQDTAFRSLVPARTTIGRVSTVDPLPVCPSNANQTASAVLDGNPTAGFIVSPYVWTNDRSMAPEATMPAMPGVARMPPLEYHERFVSVRKPSETELAADWIMSDGPAGGKWTGTTAPTRPGVYDTSHMKGSLPAGGNIAFFDGHVEWKDFDIGKATAVPQFPGGPAFWFINP